MRTLLILLLLCWLSSAADGLKCYTCMGTDHAACNRNTEPCEEPHDTCMSVMERIGNVTAITKQCTSADDCMAAVTAASVTGSGTAAVTCCISDLCNSSGATTACLHMLLLALPLCIISALCYVSA